MLAYRVSGIIGSVAYGDAKIVAGRNINHVIARCKRAHVLYLGASFKQLSVNFQFVDNKRVDASALIFMAIFIYFFSFTTDS